MGSMVMYFTEVCFICFSLMYVHKENIKENKSRICIFQNIYVHSVVTFHNSLVHVA